MKTRITLLTICLIIVANCNAQVPRPYWANNVIQAPESGKYIFVYGEWNGNTPEESKSKAFADAVVKGQFELGSVTISAQDIATIEKDGLDAAMRFTNRQIKITCQTDPIIIEHGDGYLYKSYVLIQMSIYSDKSAKFYDLPKNWDCIDDNYYSELARYNERLKSVKKQKDKQKIRADKQVQRADKRYYARERRRERWERLWADSYDFDYNKYFSLAIGNGISYGGCNIIGAQLTRRFGGIFGIEPHIGVGISHKSFEEKSGADFGDIEKYSKWKMGVYSVGINIFLYKGFYTSINYGVNELYVHDHFYDDYEQRYYAYKHSSEYYYDHISYERYVYTEYYGYSEEDRFDLESYKGMSFVLGYKYYWDGGYLDFGAGAKCYSETNPSFGFDKTAFTWNIGFGTIF